MEYSPEIQNQIDAYLTGQMMAAEKLAFENSLKKDSSLAAAVAWEQFLRRGLNTIDMKKGFEALHKTALQPLEVQERTSMEKHRKAGVFKVNKPTEVFNWRPYAVAACVVGLLVGSWFVYTRQNPEQDSPQMAQQSKPTPNTSDNGREQEKSVQKNSEKPQVATNSTIRRTPDDFLNEQEQSQLLSEKTESIDFALSDTEKEALFKRYFDEKDIYNQPLDDWQQKFNEAIQSLQVQKPAEAIELLHQIVRSTADESLRQKAQWNAALAYLMAGQVEETLRIASLTRQQSANLYQKKAEQLYQRLR